MTEIADIGFRVNTADLEKGAQGLNKLAAAAAGVDTATIKMAKLSEAAGISAARAAKIAADAEYKKAQALRANLIASGNASREELKAAKNAELAANAKLKQARAAELNTALLNAESEAIRRNNALQMASLRPSTRISSIASQGTISTAPIARDQMPNRFNTANIAAQFQDIGVTAAMGMNPMTIALQQGTQLSAIMNSMESPLKGIAEAFRSIFNATSLLAIGLVGVVAALIQFTDWTKVGETVLNGLASVIEYLGPLIVGLGAGLLFLNFASVATGATTLFAAMGSLAVATAAAAKAALAFAAAWALTPIGMITIAVTALATGLAYASGAFDDAGNAVRGWAKDLVKANNDVNNLSKTINQQTIDLFNQIEAMKLHGKERLAFVREQELMNQAIREYKGTDLIGYIDSVEPTIKKAAKAYAEYTTNINAAEEAERKRERARNKKPKEDPFEKLVGDANRKISVLKAEQAAIGMTEQAAARLRYETELLNEAQQKGIKLDEEKRTKIGELAAGMAETEAETARLKDAYDFLRDAGKGFISDLRTGLQEGKNIWESFGNAVKNVIDKIIDKILNSQIEGLLGALVPSGGGGAGGLLGGLAGLLGGGFGGSGAGIDAAIGASISANPSIFAKGGAFNNGLIPFAKGGAFTNGIVNRATPFAFANGGAFGVMGEAGPEAVMPLHRGPDGSLGVRMSGGASNDNAAPQQNVTYVINAPGASKADLESVKQTLMAMAGPGVTEQRVQMAQARGVL